MKLNGRWVVLGMVIIYFLLWFLTATWGISDVDQTFDSQFKTGTAQAFVEPDGSPAPQVEIQRIENMANVTDLFDPANQLPEDPSLFRYRTKGVAVAPFLVLDDAAVVWGPLQGFGGRRLNLWFFGFTRWWLVKAYWHV